MTRLLSRLFADDCGAVLTLEYLTLGSVVGLGGAAGLTSMTDSMNAECREFGHSVREVTRGHRATAATHAPARPAADGPVASWTDGGQPVLDMTP